MTDGAEGFGRVHMIQGHRASRWRTNLALAFCFGVMSIPSGMASNFKPALLRDESDAKSAYLDVVKNISVSDIAVKIPLRPRIEELWESKRFTCPENYINLNRCFSLILWDRRQWLVFTDLGPNHFEEARRFTVVLDNEFELQQPWLVASGFAIGAGKHPRALDCGNMSGHPFGDTPQPASGPPQCNGRKGQNYGKDGSNGTVIFLGERPQTIDMDHERGVTFVLLLIAGLF